MTRRDISSDLIGPGTVVGTVHSAESLRAARRLPAGLVDLLELRVDHFAADPAPLLRAAPALPAPFIVTVRHPAEGGQNHLNLSRRRALYTAFLPVAAALDLELRSLPALAGIAAAARARGIPVIISAHDFRATPSAARLREILRRATAAGADIIKIAARADTTADLARLLALFAVPLNDQPSTLNPPLSVMAMGRFGKISRLLFAQAGSVLNYAHLGTANAPGQWSAPDFRARLVELV